MTSQGWSTQQLAEFLEAMASASDVATARRAALERLSEALGAELSAIVAEGEVLVFCGVDPGQASTAAMAAVTEGRSKAIEMPGLGRYVAHAAPVSGERDASLLVGRSGATGFSSEELNMVRGVAHALAMGERLLGGLAEERALRQKSEQEARERHTAEENYRSLVERLPAIVYTAEMGEAGRWSYVSPQIEEILGFTPEEWTSDPRRWLKQLHPEDRERALSQESERVLGERDPPPIDYRLLTRDGSEIWVLDEAVLERDEAGRLVWHGVLYDISERKRAERELERRATQQATVARLGERALKGVEMDALLESAVSFIAATEGIGQSCVWELQQGSENLTLQASVGFGEQPDGLSIRATPETPAGLALVSRQPVTVTDWATEDRFELPPHLRDSSVRSTLAVAIEGSKAPLGVIEAHSERAGAFSPQDVHFAQSAANVLADAIERKVADKAIRHRSLHDHVTGLPNRPLFVDQVEHELGMAQRRATPLAVFLLDLDHFKVLNDSLGHHMGDQMLKAVVPRLRNQLRSADTVARFGGDEFAILVEEVFDEAEARRIAERILDSFEEPFTIEGLDQHVTASLGIAISDARTESAETLVRDAHSALYRAKDCGRNRAEVFDQKMRSAAVRRLEMERQLRRALDRDELELHFQPIISLGRGEILALEALLRWQHPEYGTISPLEFIPVAEESGLIDPLGRWVLERACQQAIAWHQLRPDGRPIDVSVNLSARQFTQGGLPGTVASTLARTGLDPVHLKLEITESVLVEKSKSVDEMLLALNELGAKLILDDFGTGYSSLAYLNRFPLDAIKVDRSFIEGLGIEPARSAIVEAIVAMARAMGLKTIAEGVENEVQLAELRRLNCDYAQGFLFSRPLPVAEMTALLERAAASPPFSLVPPTPEPSPARAPR